MAQRAAAAKLLLEGKTYAEIMDSTEISSATLSRVSRAVRHGSGGYARLITVTALVDGALAGHYIADGLVVATPTGSTGYSLSAGGPIISPKVDCMVLTPICAHSLQHRPTVVQGSAQIRLLLGSDAPQSACLQVDGQTYAQLDDGAVVEISRADRTLQLIRTSDQPFFNLVREKLTEWTR